MNKKLNVAIIGQGRSGRDIHGLYFKSPENKNFNVAAVVEKSEERRERAKNEYCCDAYSDYTELFGRNDIDIVVNSSYSHMHMPISIDLLNHGFNVVCEKPFAKCYEDAARVVKAAERNGKMLNVFQQSRFAPYFTKLCEILDSGKLGEPMQIGIKFNSFARRWDWQVYNGYAGGGVRNTGPHPLDQALYLLGFPDNINVFSKLGCANSFGDAEDYAKIILNVPGKPLVDLEISSCSAYPTYLYTIDCTRGSLRANHKVVEYKYFNPGTAPEHRLTLESLSDANGNPAYCSEKLDWTEEKIDIVGDVFNIGTQKYYGMIYDYLVNGKPMEVNIYQILKQMKVIDLIRAQNPLEIMEAE